MAAKVYKLSSRENTPRPTEKYDADNDPEMYKPDAEPYPPFFRIGDRVKIQRGNNIKTLTKFIVGGEWCPYDGALLEQPGSWVYDTSMHMKSPRCTRYYESDLELIEAVKVEKQTLQVEQRVTAAFEFNQFNKNIKLKISLPLKDGDVTDAVKIYECHVSPQDPQNEAQPAKIIGGAMEAVDVEVHDGSTHVPMGIKELIQSLGVKLDQTQLAALDNVDYGNVVAIYDVKGSLVGRFKKAPATGLIVGGRPPFKITTGFIMSDITKFMTEELPKLTMSVSMQMFADELNMYLLARGWSSDEITPLLEKVLDVYQKTMETSKAKSWCDDSSNLITKEDTISAGHKYTYEIGQLVQVKVSDNGRVPVGRGVEILARKLDFSRELADYYRTEFVEIYQIAIGEGRPKKAWFTVSELDLFISPSTVDEGELPGASPGTSSGTDPDAAHHRLWKHVWRDGDTLPAGFSGGKSGPDFSLSSAIARGGGPNGEELGPWLDAEMEYLRDVKSSGIIDDDGSGLTEAAKDPEQVKAAWEDMKKRADFQVIPPAEATFSVLEVSCPLGVLPAEIFDISSPKILENTQGLTDEKDDPGN